MAFGYGCRDWRVMAAAREWGFPSLTALRRSDILAFSKSTNEPWFVRQPWLL
jgi:hypothetical protein